VTATEAGKVFADEARKILASFERAVVDARRAGGEDVPLRIGCLPHLSIDRLLQFLRGLEQRELGLRPQIAHLPSLEQIKRLRSGQLDIGILHRGEELPELEFEPLFEGEPGAAFLPRRHRLAGQQVLTPADLHRETLVTFPRALNPSVYDLWLNRLMEAGYEWESVIEAGGITSRDLLIAAAETQAVTLGPLSYRDEILMQRLELEARWLDPPVAMADMSLVWAANPPRHLASIVTRVRELARELRQDQVEAR
jgi:DNA-binding transcriptional LysR family regulator